MIDAITDPTQPARTSCLWVIYWPEIEPTICRYQTPVTLAQVLGEHHAAIAAEPIHYHKELHHD